MNPLIESILSEIKEKHKDSKEWWNTKYELERILDSQFKVLRNTIEDKDLRTVNIIYLGKVKPTKWFFNNKEMLIEKARQTNVRYQEYRKNLKTDNNV